MILACSCLNVRIHGKESFCQLEDVNSLGLPENVLSDPFFESQVYRVPLELGGVTVSQKMLIKLRNAEKWKITTCACCMMDIYAKKEGDEEAVIVCSKAETNSNCIKSLMASERYSSLFKLVLPEINENFIQNNIGIQFHKKNIDLSIEFVQSQVSDYLKDEQKDMEERIRKFTEQQQTLYTKLLQKVRKSKQSMIYLMIQCKDSETNAEKETPKTVDQCIVEIKNNSDISPKTDYAFDERGTSDLHFSKTISQFNHRRLKRAMSNPASVKIKPKKEYKHAPFSIDIGGVFDIEDLDIEPRLSDNSAKNSDDSEHDSDDNVESIERIQRSERPEIASSLPISIPVFSNVSHSAFIVNKDNDIKVKHKDPSPTAPEEIAASMKAMACSVRDGTEMFGELPRRRLNTGELLVFKPPAQ